MLLELPNAHPGGDSFHAYPHQTVAPKTQLGTCPVGKRGLTPLRGCDPPAQGVVPCAGCAGGGPLPA